MASTYTPRPHSVAAPFSLLGSDPTRQLCHVYVSTTASNEDGMGFIAVERVVHGELPAPELNEAEQELAARITTRAGHPARAIAEPVGVEARTVIRWRAAWRKEEA
ncbi:hypothetical protein ACQEVG_21470 [Streptomyces sp. CA-135486]|uniref:hypothetical protein n=1 Tax=Streptomyces sp. CA-135486 TaxID=3240049 RepID=UPI003D8B9A27